MTKEIILTQNKVALVDDEDYEWLNRYNWCALVKGNTIYAKGTSSDTKNVYMHRFIMNTEKGMEVDHINGNGLDNRKENLRNVSKFQNHLNSKVMCHNICSYKGVSPKRGGWCARIKVGNKRIYLGQFPTPEEAALVYNEAALKYYGEFARLNEILERDI